MKFQLKSCLISRILSLVGAAIFLIPVTAHALPPPALMPAAGVHVITTDGTDTLKMPAAPTGPINVVTPPLLGRCDNQVLVSNLHYPGPNQSCAQTTPNFVAGIMGSFHFKSKCSAPSQLMGVTNASCQNTPIPGFPGAGGSVYQATVCCGIVPPLTVRFEIKKITTIPGTYTFTIACNAANGSPYIPTPNTVTMGAGGSGFVSVPAGVICGVTETQLGLSWNTPIFSGSGVQVVGSGWQGKVGPINANGGVVNVANQPKEVSTCGANPTGMCGGTCIGRDQGKVCQPMEGIAARCGCSDARPPVRFDIRKSTGTVPIPGTYTFNVMCGPVSYTGPNPITVTLPSPGVSTVSVPAGDTCSVTEATPTTGSWNTPTFTGSGVAVNGSGWRANVGPISANGGVVNVANQPKEQGCGLIPGSKTCGGPCADKRMVCQKDEKSGGCGCSEKSGSLTVLKNVVNPLGAPTPPNFSITAKCTPPSGLPVSTPLSVPANGGVSLANPIPANSSCSVTEMPSPLPSIPNVKACNGGSASWTTSYSPPVTIMAGTTATLTVTNTLACDRTCPDGQTEVSFPWAPKPYCCDGKDGRVNPDKFCCYPVRRYAQP